MLYARFKRRKEAFPEMARARGIVMFLAACFAFWRGWKLHTGHLAVLAYTLGALALALAAWHLARKPDRRRM